MKKQMGWGNQASGRRASVVNFIGKNLMRLLIALALAGVASWSTGCVGVYHDDDYYHHRDRDWDHDHHDWDHDHEHWDHDHWDHD